MIIDVWTKTWPEVIEASKNNIPVNDHSGHLICSRDRKLELSTAWNLYIHSVGWAFRNEKDIPEKVRAYFKPDQGLGLVPKREYTQAIMTKTSFEKVVCIAHTANKEVHPVVLNKKGKPFTWSFSAINDFLTCPLKYAEARFYCTSPWEDSEALRWGNKVHEALEHRIKKGTPLPPEMAEYEKYVLAALSSGGDVKAEMEIAVDRNWKPVSWFGKTAWGRCKVDVTIDKGDKVAVWDWKTGKVKDNDLQLDLSALFASVLLPKAEIFIPKFIFLAHDVITPQDKVIQKSDLVNIKERVTAYVTQMEEAWETEIFPAKPSGLCRNWCSVTACEHNGRR